VTIVQEDDTGKCQVLDVMRMESRNDCGSYEHEEAELMDGESEGELKNRACLPSGPSV